MPYVPGAVVHGVTHIADVYRSGNVYANNVPVALWLAPGTSAAFAGIVISDPVELLPEAAQVETQTAEYINNPSAFNNPEAAANGVKQYYQPITVDVSTSSEAPASAQSDMIAFFDSLLEEASRGMWRESGQGGKPSNPNITNIWKELGFPSSGPWVTDQTPWCAGFANWVLKRTGRRWAKDASAYSWDRNPTRWSATSVPIANMEPGDIVVWNFSHVNFCYQAVGGKYSFIGGNQTPTSGKNNNPADGDCTVSWGGPTGKTPIWTPSRGGIKSVYRIGTA